jgi:hypothetical protein
MAGGGEEEAEAAALEFTLTWIVAAACSVILLLSLVAERFLHYLGKVRASAKIPACFRFLGACLIHSIALSRSIPAADMREPCCSCARADAEEEKPEAALRGAPQGQRRYCASVNLLFFLSISSVCRRHGVIRRFDVLSMYHGAKFHSFSPCFRSEIALLRANGCKRGRTFPFTVLLKASQIDYLVG